jgi:hypothetical protein
VSGSTFAQAQQSAAAPKNLFQPTSLAPKSLKPKELVEGPYVVRYQPTLVDLDLLPATHPQAKFNLNLFSDASFLGVVERVDRRAERRFTVAGHLEDVPYGSFTIVVEEDVAAGTFRVPTESPHFFSLRYAGDGLHLICEIDSEKFPPCAGAPPSWEGPRAFAGAQDTQQNGPPPESLTASPGDDVCSPLPPVFDAMIVYSNIARQAAAGTNAINALCQLAIDETNEAYGNSQIGARVRLVYRGEVTYNESGTYEDHLDQLTDDSDGVLDEVHTLRDSYRADFVSLWVDDPCYCGIGWCTSDDDRAFTIVCWNCATGNYTYAHEMGHNQGCAHAVGDGTPPTERGDGLFDYSHGWRFSGDSGSLFRTIMAYHPGTRIQHFSNPNVLFDGQPTGIPVGDPNEALNAQTINRRRATCEGFRQTRFDIWVDCTHSGIELGTFSLPYNALEEAVQQIITGVGASELPTLWIKAGICAGDGNVPITFGKPLCLRSCGGTAFVGDSVSLTAWGRVRIHEGGGLRIN